MNSHEFKAAVGKAKKIFAEIKTKYVGLSGHLIFSSELGRCKVTDDLMKILQRFPDMIEPSFDKEKGLTIIRRIESIGRKTGKGKATLNAKDYECWEQAMTELEQILEMLKVKDDVFVEIEFKKIITLASIIALREEGFILHGEKQQNKAPMRIVLGTLQAIYQNSKILQKTPIQKMS